MAFSQDGAVPLSNTLGTNRFMPSKYKNQTLKEVVQSLVAWQNETDSVLKAAQDAMISLRRKTAAIEN